MVVFRSAKIPSRVTQNRQNALNPSFLSRYTIAVLQRRVQTSHREQSQKRRICSIRLPDLQRNTANPGPLPDTT